MFMNYDFKVEILRCPTEEDWMRAKQLACNTVGKKAINLPTEEWKRKLLKSEHSPARTLMFTFRLTLPYYVSVHFVRHKFGVEHFVTSQRNDRQDNYDRTQAPQNSEVIHIMDINATELIFMSHRRLCNQADPATRAVMKEICKQVEMISPEFKGLLVPQCEYLHECPEFYPCGYWDKNIHLNKETYEMLLDSNRKLNALECGGVDNWEGYSYSLSEFYKNRLEDDE